MKESSTYTPTIADLPTEFPPLVIWKGKLPRQHLPITHPDRLGTVGELLLHSKETAEDTLTLIELERASSARQPVAASETAPVAIACVVGSGSRSGLLMR